MFYSEVATSFFLNFVSELIKFTELTEHDNVIAIKSLKTTPRDFRFWNLKTYINKKINLYRKL